jgi:hypothetical protein
MMNCKIFYSWQSDLPNATNRGFIEKALENAAKSIRNDDSIKVEPVIDRDTKDVPGSPDIAHTIFDKIEQAQVFVCDVSIINQNAPSRPTPNPNALIELGYAIKALGWQKIILVMNTAFGKPEELPFDLRMRRAIAYYMPQEIEERATERKKLEAAFTAALRSILEGLDVPTPGEVIQPPPIGEQARVAVENSLPNQASLVHRFMEWLIDELNILAPDFSRVAVRDELLIQAIEQTKKLVLEFARLSAAIALMNNSDTALAVYKGFEPVLERYNRLPEASGSQKFNFDFYKFIGHELFVTFFSFLIQERCWKLILDLLEKVINVKNPWVSSDGYTPDVVLFSYASQRVDLLEQRNNRLGLNRTSLHAHILKERHTEGELAKLVPMQQFMDADFFLFLRAESQKDSQSIDSWFPWSTFYMEQAPRYLLEASRAKYAQQLLCPLGVKDVETLRVCVAQGAAKLRQRHGSLYPFHPLGNFDPGTIGNR